MEVILERFPMSVPQYYLSLIDRDDPADPIRRMCSRPPLPKPTLSGDFDTSGVSRQHCSGRIISKYTQTGTGPFHELLRHVLQTRVSVRDS